MQTRRAAEKQGEPAWMVGPDRSQRRQQRDLYKMGVSFYKMLVMLAEAPISNLVVNDDEYEVVKANLAVWLGRIYEMQRNEKSDMRGPTIQSSRNDRPKLTVITESELTVNSELDDEEPNPDDRAGPQ
jgi:hypothetical protein